MRFCPECGKALLPAMSPLPALLAGNPIAIKLPAPRPGSDEASALPLPIAHPGAAVVEDSVMPARESATRQRREMAFGTQRWSDVEDRSSQIAADTALLSWQAQFERRVVPVVITVAVLTLGGFYSAYFERGDETDSGSAFAFASSSSPTAAGSESEALPAPASSGNGSPAILPGPVQVATLFPAIPQPVGLNLDTRSSSAAEVSRPLKAPATVTRAAVVPPAGGTAKAPATTDARKPNGTRAKSAPDKPREEKPVTAEAEPPATAPADVAAPPPVIAASPAAATEPDWLLALRGDMDRCRKLGFLERTLCIERAKWKHCATSAWGTLPECPGGRQQPEQRTAVSLSSLD